MAGKIKVEIRDPDWQKYDFDAANIQEVVALLNKMNPGTEWAEYTNEGTEEVVKIGRNFNGTLKEYHVVFHPWVYFPNWSNKDKASKEDQKTWDLFAKALKKHELGHHKIMKRCCKELQMLLSQELKKSKLITETVFAAIGAHIATKIDVEMRAYDRNTQHGKTEGAWIDL